jgi:amidase
LVELGKREHLTIPEAEVADLELAVARIVEMAGSVLHIPGVELEESPYRNRWPGRVPSDDEDPINAFVRFCLVEGNSVGPLRGFRVGVKDHIDVGGVPTTNASPTVSSTPTHDATVVERILEAGGQIVGKLNMDDFSMGATGETSAFGPTRNPHSLERSAGGSSSGSGAALAANAVDLALGGDSGGSARVPASYCGVVAIMATYGLVSNYGVTPHDNTVGSVCPMARTVREAALLLDVIGGPDWRDHQWVRDYRDPGSCAEGLDGASTSLDGLRIGLVSETVAEDRCEEKVLMNLHAARKSLEDAGATVVSVSVPLWTHGMAIAQPLLTVLGGAMLESFGAGHGHLGVIDEDRVHRLGATLKAEGHLFPALYKVMLLVTRYFREEYLNVPYAHLQNLRLRLRREVTEALQEVDLLLTPTTPTTAPLLVDEMSAAVTTAAVVDNVTYDTCVLNMTGNPVVAVPTGFADGLPTSAQVIGRHWEDALAVKGAHVIDAALGQEAYGAVGRAAVD